MLEQMTALAEQLEMAQQRADRAERETEYFAAMMEELRVAGDLDDDVVAEIRPRVPRRTRPGPGRRRLGRSWRGVSVSGTFFPSTSHHTRPLRPLAAFRPVTPHHVGVRAPKRVGDLRSGEDLAMFEPLHLDEPVDQRAFDVERHHHDPTRQLCPVARLAGG
jgi:hypothetical protein